MKTFLGIIVGLMIVFSNITALAVPSSQATPVTVRLKIHNQSSVASLTYWNFSYTRSFPDMSSYMPALFPVNPNSSGQPPLSIKIPIQQPAISASLVYGYDFSNFCLFLFSYSNNQLTVTPTPHGGVDCGTPVVLGKVVTIVINQRREQQSAPTPTINSESIDVTVHNNSAASLNLFNYIAIRNTSFPLPQPLQKISGYSKKVFSIPVEPPPSSQYLLYGYNDNNFCKFQFLLSSSNAVSVKTVTQQGNIRCFVIMSGNNFIIKIFKVQNITIHIQNDAAIPTTERISIPGGALTVPISGSVAGTKLPLLYHDYHFVYNTNDNNAPRPEPIPILNLPNILGGKSKNFSVTLYPGDVIHMMYGLDSDNGCSFQIAYSKTDTEVHILAAEPYRLGQESWQGANITCQGLLGERATVSPRDITFSVGLQGWQPSAFCVRLFSTMSGSLADEYAKQFKHPPLLPAFVAADLVVAPVKAIQAASKNKVYLKVITDGMAAPYYKLSTGHSLCFNYYKNIAVGVADHDYRNMGVNFYASSLDKNGVMQQGLFNRGNLILKAGCVYLDTTIPAPQASSYRQGYATVNGSFSIGC